MTMPPTAGACWSWPTGACTWPSRAAAIRSVATMHTAPGSRPTCWRNVNPEGYWLLPIAGIGTIEFRTGSAQTIIAPTEKRTPRGNDHETVAPPATLRPATPGEQQQEHGASEFLDVSVRHTA